MTLDDAKKVLEDAEVIYYFRGDMVTVDGNLSLNQLNAFHLVATEVLKDK